MNKSQRFFHSKYDSTKFTIFSDDFEASWIGNAYVKVSVYRNLNIVIKVNNKDENKN